MPPKKAKAQRKVSLQISQPELWHLEFTRREAPPPPVWGEVQFLIGVRLLRASIERLLVEFSIEINDEASFQAHVIYRIGVDVTMPDAAPGELDRELHLVATQVAPSTLYPFVRETIMTMMAKAGLPTLVLPLVNFRGLLDPKEVHIPPPPSDMQPVADQS